MLRKTLLALLAAAIAVSSLNGQEGWNRIAPSEPILRLGSEMGGSEEASFFRPRGIVPLGDTIFLLEGGASEIRIFDRTGAFLGRFGGSGEGPGEFVMAYRMALRDSTIVVTDPRQRRLTSFTVTGELLDTERIPHPAAIVFDHAIPLRGGFTVGSTQVSIGTERGRHTDQAVVLFSETESLIDTLAVYHGGVIGWSSDEGFGFLSSPSHPSVRGGTCGIRGDSVIVVVEATTGRVRWWRVSEKGAEEQPPIQLPFGDPVPFTDDDLDEIVEQENRERVERGRSRLARSTTFYAPDYWPQAGGLVVTDRLEVWVEWDRPGVMSDGKWFVADLESGGIAQVRLPPGLHLMAISEGRVYGVRRTEFDVPIIEVYELRRSPFSP